jgi:Beta-lactamase
MSPIYGSCHDPFLALRNLLSDNLSSGADIGASIAVFIDGEPVVDIWGGHADEARTRPWERDTLTKRVLFDQTSDVPTSR